MEWLRIAAERREKVDQDKSVEWSKGSVKIENMNLQHLNWYQFATLHNISSEVFNRTDVEVDKIDVKVIQS